MNISCKRIQMDLKVHSEHFIVLHENDAKNSFWRKGCWLLLLISCRTRLQSDIVLTLANIMIAVDGTLWSIFEFTYCRICTKNVAFEFVQTVESCWIIIFLRTGNFILTCWLRLNSGCWHLGWGCNRWWSDGNIDPICGWARIHRSTWKGADQSMNNHDQH